MAEKMIYAGDSYALRRPLFTYTFVDDLGNPFDLAGCTIRTTFKPAVLPISKDPIDDTAVVRHKIIIGLDGTPTAQTGLYLTTPSTDGKVEERLTSSESRLLPTNVTLYADAELTDANGEVFTWLFTDTLRVIDVVTNRTT